MELNGTHRLNDPLRTRWCKSYLKGMKSRNPFYRNTRVRVWFFFFFFKVLYFQVYLEAMYSIFNFTTSEEAALIEIVKVLVETDSPLSAKSLSLELMTRYAGTPTFEKTRQLFHSLFYTTCSKSDSERYDDTFIKHMAKWNKKQQEQQKWTVNFNTWIIYWRVLFLSWVTRALESSRKRTQKGFLKGWSDFERIPV